jgi:Predicted transcription factor, homolog of eukaryotic MBF1
MSPEQPSSKIGKSVGEKIRAARLAQHYTQNQLAAPDFSVSYISAIERGQIQPSLRALELLAARLSINPTQLLPTKPFAEERTGRTAPGERDESEIALELLHAQIQILQDEAPLAIPQLQKMAKLQLAPQLQLQHDYLLGQAYYHIGQYQESEYVLSEATQLATELQAPYLHLHILYQLAITHAAMRNYTQALLFQQRCLHLLEETKVKDPLLLTQIYIQMGQYYMRLDNSTQALETFHQALAITEQFTTSEQIQTIYSHLCHYYTDAKEYELATLYAYKNIQLHNQENMLRLRSDLYHYLGRAILQTDAQQARTYLDEALQNQHNRQDIFTYASLLTHNADWYLLQQDYEQAEQQAQQAFDLLKEFGDLMIAAESLIVLGRVNYALQRYNESSQHFVAGLDMLERLGNHEELANESVRYAELLEKIGLEHEAFTHFRRAFQSRQKLGR